MLSSLLLILLSAVVICHFALTHVPALRPLAEVDAFDEAKYIAAAVGLCVTVTTPLTFALQQQVLQPLGIGYLQPLLFIVSIMVVAQLARWVLEIAHVAVTNGTALFALITGNSAVLGAALIVADRSDSLGDAAGFGLAIGASFALLLLCLTTLQQRLRYAAIAQVFRDAPLALVTVGIMALALMGFTGLIAE